MILSRNEDATINYKHIDLTMAFHYVHHASEWFFCNEFSFLSAIGAEVGVSNGELTSDSCQGQGVNVSTKFKHVRCTTGCMSRSAVIPIT